MSKKTKKISSKQARHLRGLGHHLSPLAMIGKEGLTPNMLKAVEEVLKAHELIKVKVQNNCPIARKEAAEQLANKTNSIVMQIIGKIILLYRENPDLDPDVKISLP